MGSLMAFVFLFIIAIAIVSLAKGKGSNYKSTGSMNNSTQYDHNTVNNHMFMHTDSFIGDGGSADTESDNCDCDSGGDCSGDSGCDSGCDCSSDCGSCGTD